MMKFFRKHNKEMLVALLAFLIVIWLAGDALQSAMRPVSNVLLAKSKFGDIRQEHQAEAMKTTEILQGLGFDWEHPVPGSRTPLSPLDWILAQREAESLGTKAKVEAVHAWTTISDDDVNRVARARQVRPSEVRSAIRDFRSVQLAALALAGSTLPSVAELRAAAVNELDKVKVRCVVLPASAFVDKAQEFSDAELTAHFNLYRDRKKGEGLEFGYLIQPSVKVQYVKVDRDAIAAKMGVANLDQRAKAYYDENKDKLIFKRPSEEVKETPEGAEKPAEKPPQWQWDEPEAKKIALDVVRKRAADDAAARLGDWLAAHLREAWVDAEVNRADGYKVAPKEVADLGYYEQVLKRVPSNLAYPDAVKVATTDFFQAITARQVPEIGTASHQPERGGLSYVGNVAFRTKGLIPKIPNESGVNPNDYLAPYQSFTNWLRDPATGNVFVFRVIDTRDEHAPDTLAEVRDQVVTDMRLLKAFEVARTRADELKDNAMAVKSLKEAFDKDEDLAPVRSLADGGYSEPEAFSRVRQGMSAVVRTSPTTFVSAQVGRLPNDVIDDLFHMETCEDKVHAYEIRQRAAFFVAEFVEVQRGREDEFVSAKDRLALAIAEKRQSEVMRDWLNPENIRLRAGFKPAGQ